MKDPIRLELDARGLLPDGVFDATLEDIERLFVATNPTDRRIELFANLKKYLLDAKQLPVKWTLIVNGSFVMSKVDEPSDIDAVIVMPMGWRLSKDGKDRYVKKLIEYHMVKNKYNIELFVENEGEGSGSNMTEYFRDINLKWCPIFGHFCGERKGLIKVRSD